MTTPIAELSRDELADKLDHHALRSVSNISGTHGVAAASASRLRADGERIRALEAQLAAANGKVGDAIKVGDRLRYKNCEGYSGVGVVLWVDSEPDVGYPYRVRLEGSDESEWMNDDEIVERLPTEIETGDRVRHNKTGVVGEVYENDFGLLDVRVSGEPALQEWGDGEVTRLPPEPAKPVDVTSTVIEQCKSISVEPARDGKERRYGPEARKLSDVVAVSDLYGMPLCKDLALHLQAVLAGLAEVAAEMERVPLGSGGLQAYVWAAKLRRLANG